MIGIAPLAAGCSTRAPLDQAGVEVSPGAGWTPVALTTWAVPGVPLAAWSGPGGASFVVYSGLSIPDARPDLLARSIATRLTNLPEVKVLDSGTMKVSGAEAARVIATAQGTGGSFAPTGAGQPVSVSGKPLLLTRRVLVTIPRTDDTISLVWHAPEAEAARLDAAVADTLKTLRLRQVRSASQSY